MVRPARPKKGMGLKMNTRAEPLRAGLAIVTAIALALAMMLVTSGPAAGSGHIDATGPVQDNCVAFEGGNIKELGTKSPLLYPDVDITLVSWDDLDENGEPHGFTFTVTGLEDGQHVEVLVKSGTDEDFVGPFGNGTHPVDGPSDHAVSHVRICVFESETTTTSTTTTTVPDTTTTTVADTTTTTVAEETTTTVADITTTTIEDEVLGTVITTSTTAPAVQVTTTIADEVLGTHVEAEELPFTGIDSELLVGMGVLMLMSGLLVLGVTGKREDA